LEQRGAEIEKLTFLYVYLYLYLYLFTEPTPSTNRYIAKTGLEPYPMRRRPYSPDPAGLGLLILILILIRDRHLDGGRTGIADAIEAGTGVAQVQQRSQRESSRLRCDRRESSGWQKTRSEGV
jgi:hypothetical protein